MLADEAFDKSPLPHRRLSFHCNLTGQQGLETSSLRPLISFMRTLPSWPEHLTKTLPPNTKHWPLGFNIWILGRPKDSVCNSQTSEGQEQGFKPDISAANPCIFHCTRAVINKPPPQSTSSCHRQSANGLAQELEKCVDQGLPICEKGLLLISSDFETYRLEIQGSWLCSGNPEQGLQQTGAGVIVSVWAAPLGAERGWAGSSHLLRDQAFNILREKETLY